MMGRLLDGRIFIDSESFSSWGGAEGEGLMIGCDRIDAPTNGLLPITDVLSFHAFPLSHGRDPPPSSPTPSLALPPRTDYSSTAFFIQESTAGKELLFFGDVEADSVSGTELNKAVWRFAAGKIVEGILTTIFIECSYPVRPSFLS